MNTNIIKTDNFYPSVECTSPCLIEGVELYKQVAPISKLTGKRENPINLLRKITAGDSARARLLDSVLQDIPAIKSDPRLSDADRTALLGKRLAIGTPAEDELFMRDLENISDVLWYGAKQPKPKEVVDPVKEPVVVSSDPE